MNLINLIVSILLLSLINIAYINSINTLVLLDNHKYRTLYKKFFENLLHNKHVLTFRLIDDDGIVISKFNEYNYENIIIISPIADSFGNGLNIKDITHFVSSGRNMMVIGASLTGELVRNVGNEFGLDYQEHESNVIDHFSYNSTFDATIGKNLHTVVQINGQNDPIGVFGAASKPLLFSGIGQTFKTNEMIIPVLVGNPTTYSASATSNLIAAGSDLVLVSALQSRNNARITFSGSFELCSDAFTSLDTLGNDKFCNSLSSWTFQTRSILRAVDVVHGKTSSPNNSGPTRANDLLKTTYRIKDTIEYSLKLEELVDGKWKPFIADDVQIEAIMLDAYIRTTLKASTDGVYKSTFMLPDVPGIYTLRVLYNRVGYSILDIKDEVKVRPFNTNEYERFLVSAYPYYASTGVICAAFFIFCIIFILEKKEKKEEKAIEKKE